MGWERGGGGGDTKKSRRRRRSGRKRTQLAQRNISKARVKERESERKRGEMKWDAVAEAGWALNLDSRHLNLATKCGGRLLDKVAFNLAANW